MKYLKKNFYKILKIKLKKIFFNLKNNLFNIFKIFFYFKYVKMNKLKIKKFSISSFNFFFIKFIKNNIFLFYKIYKKKKYYLLKKIKNFLINNIKIKKKLKQKKFLRKKRKFFSVYNISFFCFNFFYYFFFMQKILYFGFCLKKNFKKINLKEEKFLLILTKDDFFNITANSIALYFRTQFLENLSIYDFLFEFLNFFNNNPFFLNYKIILSGRFSRSSRSKIKIFKKGTIPLNTFKIPIDFGFSNCVTKFGVCGVKIFIHKSIYNFSKKKKNYRVFKNRLKYLNIENKKFNFIF